MRSRPRLIPLGLALAAALLTASLQGCMVHRHRVGVGPNGLSSESHRQVYLFFGLLRLGDVDPQRLAGDVSGYEVVTEYSFVDFLLQPFLLVVTGTSRTVTIYR